MISVRNADVTSRRENIDSTSVLIVCVGVVTNRVRSTTYTAVRLGYAGNENTVTYALSENWN